MIQPNLLAFIAASWIGVLCSGGCTTIENPDSLSVLQLLRANDAKFDNLNLKYTRFEDHKIRPDRFQFSKFGEDPSTMPQDFWTPRTVKWVRSCSLVVRGHDAVYSSQFEPSLSEEDKYITPSAYTKYGNINGIVYDLSDMQLSNDDPSKDVPNYEKQLRITRLRSPMGGLYDCRMAVEFAHGVGFGKRIKSIASVTTKGDRLIITGQIKIWTEDVSEFEIELDEQYLVRKTAIRSNVQGHETLFEVFTEGTVMNDGLLLASSGFFQRMRQPSTERRNKGDQTTVDQAFHIKFNSVEQNLSDERYEKLSQFKIEPLMQVTDRVNNIRGTAVEQEDGRVVVEQW